ncbi:MAG: helix-turn-helix transcriptional regulator [Bacteroidota bacterium]
MFEKISLIDTLKLLNTAQDMGIGTNIKKLREQKGLLQKQVAEELGIGNSNYSKIENGIREITVKELQKLSKLFDMSIDQIVNFDGDIPEEVTLQDKSNMEQLNLINQLDEEDRDTVFKIIDTMLTKKKFKDFFQKNVAAL